MWDESITAKKNFLERQKADGRKVNDLADPRKLKEAKPIVRKTEKQSHWPDKTFQDLGGCQLHSTLEKGVKFSCIKGNRLTIPLRII